MLVDASNMPDSSHNNSIKSSFREGSLSSRGTVFSRSTSHEAGLSISSSLHGNLMRTIKNRDPMKIFEVVCVIGEGSMGSVAKVKKKESAIGGSARAHLVAKKGIPDWCFFPLFSFCQPKNFNPSKSDNALVMTSSTAVTTQSSYRSSSLHDSGNSFPQLQHNTSLVMYGSKKEVYYALKSIHLDRCSNADFQKELKNEVAILKGLDHPNIVRAIETFNYRNRLYIVLELCSGGDLYARDPYNERDAFRIVGSLLSAVSYLHSKGIIHRDLKFENVMFTDRHKQADVKIIDFGLSRKFAANEHLKDAVGTVYTMAPELVAGDYDSKADVWSIGVITFMLLSSSMPFYGKSRHQVLKKIMRGRFHFTSRRWKHVSEEAQDFVRTLLLSDPERRPCADAALRLPWMMKKFQPEEVNVDADIEMMDAIQGSIQAFAGYGTLKKLALMVVAYRSTVDELGFLRNMFARFDSSKNGEISEDEFTEALAEYDYSPKEIHNLYRGIDIAGTGSVHYIEFLAATLEALGPIEEERLAEAFDRIDCDDKGYISIDNLQEFLGEEVPREYLEKIIDDVDVNKDQKISYNEFLRLWNKDSEERLRVARQNVTHRRIISRDQSFVSSVSESNSFVSDTLATTSLRMSSSVGDVGEGVLLEGSLKENGVSNDSMQEALWI